MAGVGVLGVASVGLGAVGVVASAWALHRAPAERRLAPWSALVGAAGLAMTAVLAVVLPPVSFHAPVLWGLLGGGAATGLLGGGAVRIRRDPGGAVVRGGAWHLMPAAVALLSLQVASLVEWLDGVVFATALIVACTAFAVGAVLLVVTRGAVARRRRVPAAGAVGSRRPSRLAVGLAAGAAVVLIALGAAVSGVRDSAPTATQPTDVPPTPSATPTAEPSPGTSVATPATPVAPSGVPGSRYVGQVFPSDAPPAGVSDLGGALIIDTGLATAWMAGPEGDMFWLLREAGTDAAGSVAAWEVMDVQVWPTTDDSTEVVMGVPCEVDGAPVSGVVALFPLPDEEWFVDPYAAWWADTRTGTFVPLPTSIRCQHEGYGV